MELHPLRLPDLPNLGQVARQGEIARIVRGPRTVEEVLRAASAAMDEDDRRIEMERDPVRWLRAERRRSSLFWRLFGSR